MKSSAVDSREQTGEDDDQKRRRNHSPEFKAKVTMAAVRGDKTLAELAQQFDEHPNQIQDWKKRLMSEAGQLCEHGSAHGNTGADDQALQAITERYGKPTAHVVAMQLEYPRKGAAR